MSFALHVFPIVMKRTSVEAQGETKRRENMVRAATVAVASAVLLQHASCFQLTPASALASSSSLNSARCQISQTSQISRRQGSAALSMGLFDGLWGQQSGEDPAKEEQMRIQQEMLAQRQGKQVGAPPTAGAPPPKAIVPDSVLGGPPAGMPPPPGAPPRAEVPQGVMPPPGMPPPPPGAPPQQAVPAPPQQAPSQEPGADWGEYVPPPRVEKIPVMVGNSMVQLRGMPAAPPTQAGMSAVPQLTPANLQSNLEWGLLIDTVCPPAWMETKQYKREGKIEPGALVMVSRSDGTTRFGQVRKKTGLLWQDLWEVVVSLKPDGSALATRVEEGVMLGRPFPDAVAAHKTALAPQMQMEAPASGDDQWV